MREIAEEEVTSRGIYLIDDVGSACNELFQVWLSHPEISEDVRAQLEGAVTLLESAQKGCKDDMHLTQLPERVFELLAAKDPSCLNKDRGLHKMELHPSLRMAGTSTGKKLLAQGTAAMSGAAVVDLLDLEFGEGEEAAETVIHGSAIHPNSQLRLTLDVLGLLFIFYDCVTIPVSLTFSRKDDQEFNTAFFVILAFWQTDMIVSARTGYYEKGKLILDKFMAFKKYLGTWFIVDVFVVGCDWVALFFQVAFKGSGLIRSARFFRVLRSLRILRLAKLKNKINEVRDRFESDLYDTVMDVVKSIFAITYLNHLLCCGWFYLGDSMLSCEFVDEPGCIEETSEYPKDFQRTWLREADMYEPGASFWYIYLTSLHWSLTQFTPAAMEVVPTNIYERLVAVIALIFALVVFGSFLSQLTSCVTKLRALTADKEKNFSLLRRYLNESNDLDDSLKLRIRKFLEYKLSVDGRSKIKEADVVYLKLLSQPLQTELQYFKLRKFLRISPLLDTLDEECNSALRQIAATACTVANYAAGDNLFTRGETAESVHIVISGKVRYIFNGQTMIMSDETRFAELGLFTQWYYHGTAIVLKSSKVLTLNVSQVLKAAKLYVHGATVIRAFGGVLLEMASENNPHELHLLGDLIDHCDWDAVRVRFEKVSGIDLRKNREEESGVDLGKSTAAGLASTAAGLAEGLKSVVPDPIVSLGKDTGEYVGRVLSPNRNNWLGYLPFFGSRQNRDGDGARDGTMTASRLQHRGTESLQVELSSSTRRKVDSTSEGSFPDILESSKTQIDRDQIRSLNSGVKEGVNTETKRDRHVSADSLEDDSVVHRTITL